MVSWIAAQRTGIIERLTEPFEPFGIVPKAPNPLAETEVMEGSFRGYCWVGLERIIWQASEGRTVPTQKGEAVWTVAIGHVTLDAVEAMVAIAQSRLIGLQLPQARAAIGLTRSEYEGVDRASRRIWQYSVGISVPVLIVADNTAEPEPLAKAISFDRAVYPPTGFDSDGNPVDTEAATNPDGDSPHTPNSRLTPPKRLIVPFTPED